MRLCLRSALLSCVILPLSATAAAAAAPSVAEFPIPTQGTIPQGIAALPTGGLMFAEGSRGYLGVSTVTGAVTEFGSPMPSLHMSGPGASEVVADGYVWLTEPTADKIARVTPTLTAQGTYPLQEYSLPNNTSPEGIAADSQGNVWFTASGNGGAIGEINPSLFPSSSSVTLYTAADGLTANSSPDGITVGPDGNVWFTESIGSAIGKLVPSTHRITQMATPTAGSQPTGITAGADGNLWFTESGGRGAIGKITPAGAITEYVAGLTANSHPTAIAQGPVGDVWFTENAGAGAIGWISPQGAIGQVATPTVNSQPFGITQGPDGNEWFTEDGGHGQVGMISVPAPPATTAAATSVGSTSATLTGTTNPGGFATTYHFQWGATADYGQSMPATDAAAGSGTTVQTVSQTLSGLTPNTVYHYRLVATNCGGCQAGTSDGPDMTFTTTNAVAGTATTQSPPAPSPAAPAETPIIGRTAIITPVAGTVLVRTPHSHHAVSISTVSDIPVGSVIDTRRGRVVLTTEINHHGRVQSASAWGGRFELSQTLARGMTTFRLVGRPVGCPASGATANLRTLAAGRSASAKPPTLWAHDHDGRYSTRGNNSVATVRGTWWKTTETCQGTVTYVKKGIVSVFDLHTHHATLVHAGHSFLARR